MLVIFRSSFMPISLIDLVAVELDLPTTSPEARRWKGSRNARKISTKKSDEGSRAAMPSAVN